MEVIENKYIGQAVLHFCSQGQVVSGSYPYGKMATLLLLLCHSEINMASLQLLMLPTIATGVCLHYATTVSTLSK